MSGEHAEGEPVVVVPATAARWPDVEELFTGSACWCQYWRLSAGAYGRPAAGEQREECVAARRQALQQQLERPTAPGMLAYIDGRVVGWCGLGPRAELERLARSRTIPAVDTRPVWAIVCFLVRVGYRRRGVARALLHGAIAYARAQGAPALEAYPIDPDGGRVDSTFAYVGTLAMFERAGFQRITETTARSAGRSRWLMRLELAAPSDA